MATMTLTGTEALTKSINDCREKVAAAERALRETEAEIAAHSDKLAELQAARGEECETLARGNPKASPEKFDSKIQSVRDRLYGLEVVRRGRERDCSDLRAELARLQAEQHALEHEYAVAAEREEIQGLITRTRKAIADRDEAERRIIDGLTQLRSRKYLGPKNEYLGKDAAGGLQRMSLGMR